MALHPQTAAFLAGYNASAPVIDYDTVTAAELRALFSIPKPEIGSDGLRGIEDRTIPGPAGSVSVRIYMPQGDGPLPLTLFIHGGGFCIGDVDTTDGLCRFLAEEARSLFVSVEYRCAPEAPYPASLDDCWAVLQWLAEHGSEIGGDPSRISDAPHDVRDVHAGIAETFRRRIERTGKRATGQALAWLPVCHLGPNEASTPSTIAWPVGREILIHHVIFP
ncbi:alpha/beta hydrolase fold domain-containing protein [Sphingobium lactosutens]|nr:alpha/beta hydrolase fold domain-containing protein [Sphingobium lactosutens]